MKAQMIDEEEVRSLATLRDELRLQMHLARADARDAFDRLERLWSRMEGELARVRHEATPPAEDVRKGLREIADDLRKGYERLRASMDAE